MKEENTKKKTTSVKKTDNTKKEVSTKKKAAVPKTTTEKTPDTKKSSAKTQAKKTSIETKKSPAKKTSAKPKKTEVKKTTSQNKKETVKKETKNVSSKKVSTTKKAPAKKKISTTTKKITKKKEIPVVEEVIKPVEVKEETQRPLIEIRKEVKEDINEEYVVTNIKKNDQEEVKTPNYKVIILLLLLIIFLFICGVIYIMDYSKRIGDNKDKPNSENVTYTIDDFAEKIENSSKNETVTYENVEKITVYEYEKKLKKNEKMIVLVASKYCGGCKIYEPVLNTVLGEKNLKAYKIDVAEFETEKEKNLFDSLLKITGTPTTFLIENGKAVASITSSTDKETLTTWIDENYEI